MTLLLTAMVLDVTPRWTPDESWAIETTAVVVADGQLFEVRLPGGTIGQTTVDVSDTPMLLPGASYQIELVETGSGWGLATLPLQLDSSDIDLPAPPPYDLAGSTWDYQLDPVELPFSLNTDSWPSEYAPDELETAMTDALRVWTVQGRSRAELAYGGRTTDTQYGSGSNGSNTTKYENYHWGSTLAISVRTTVGSEIRDCDLKFYGSNSNGSIDWNVDIAGAPDGQNAVRHTMVHEFGHCIGLSHSNTDGALMEAYAPAEQGPESWALHADDVAGIQAMYGTVQAELLIESTQGIGWFDVSVTNIGDGTAFDVKLDIDGPFEETTLEVNDLAAGQQDSHFVHLEEGLCGEVSLALTATDALGETWDFNVDGVFNDICPLDEGPDVDDDLEAGGGCGCSSTPSPSGLAVLLLPILILRRRSPSAR